MHSLLIIAKLSLIIGGISAVIITIDILSGNKQRMWIMNFVYPVTGLYAGFLALLFYYTIGKRSSIKKYNLYKQNTPKPFWQSVAVSALHCGSGCTLGDILAEMFLLYVPFIGSTLWKKWTIDFVFAFIIGIIFQYYSIKPMRNLSSKEALKAALKADTLSLTFWQAGMYGWMGVVIFLIFHHQLSAGNPVFWFMMQIAMLCGFITTYPINWWLLKKGIKEAM